MFVFQLFESLKPSEMNLGRQPLSELDFNKLWLSLYKQFYSLYTLETCDGSIVYDTIFIICTSNSNYETKLYWKIGDFLYNRCKEITKSIMEKSRESKNPHNESALMNDVSHKINYGDGNIARNCGNVLEEKPSTSNVSSTKPLPHSVDNCSAASCSGALIDSTILVEYSKLFIKYRKLVTTIDQLSEMLNDCMKSRRIIDFGFLLWEKCVIKEMVRINCEDNMGSSDIFFISVYYMRTFNDNYTDHNCDIKHGSNSMKTLINNPREEDIKPHQNSAAGNTNIPSMLHTATPKCNPTETSFNFDLLSHKLNILESFKFIQPNPSDPLLFYRLNYEKSAVRQFVYKYSYISRIDDLYKFCMEFRNTVNFERELFSGTFLKESKKRVFNVLERVLIGGRMKLIVKAISEEMSLKYHKRHNDIGSKGSCTHFMSHGIDAHVYGDDFCILMDEIDKIYDNKDDTLCGEYIIGDDSKNKSEDLISMNISMEIETSLNIRNNIIHFFISKLGLLNGGFDLVKRAYLAFVDENISELNGNIDEVYMKYNSILKFTMNCEEGICENKAGTKPKQAANTNMILKNILDEAFRAELRRAKPCFLTRLCEYSNKIVERSIISHRPFLENKQFGGSDSNKIQLICHDLPDQKNIDPTINKYAKSIEKTNYTSTYNVFITMIHLVSDLDEFINLYKDYFANRVLNGSSCIKKEESIVAELRKICGKSLKYQELENMMTDILSSSDMMTRIQNITHSDKYYGRADSISTAAQNNLSPMRFVGGKNSMTLVAPLDRRISNDVISATPIPNLEKYSILHSSTQSPSIKILNEAFWSIVPENPQILIPNQLWNCILSQVPSSTRVVYDGNPSVKCRYTSSNKRIKWAHQFTKIFVSVNGRGYKMNIYQYCILEVIKEKQIEKYGLNSQKKHVDSGYEKHISGRKCSYVGNFLGYLGEIISIEESKVEKNVDRMVKENIIVQKGGIYEIVSGDRQGSLYNDISNSEAGVHTGFEFVDISSVEYAVSKYQDICINSYLQAKIAATMKQAKRMRMAELKNEIKKISKFEIDLANIDEIIKTVEDKGIIEVVGDEIEYST